jgi:hypothetical protein
MKKSWTNILIVVSVTILLFSIFSLVYFFNIIKNKNINISAANIAFEKKASAQDNMNELKNKIIELGNTQKSISSHFVNTESIDTFVEYLENTGTSNDIDLSVKSVDIPKNEKNKIFVSINMTGSFSNVMKIMAILENSQYNIVINSSYLNKETSVVTDVNNLLSKGKEIPKESKSYWLANVTFTILTL